MSKTFKKSSAVSEDYEQQSHFYKFRKSKENRNQYKDIDKYLKQQDINRFEDDYEDYEEYSYNK